MLLAGPDGMRLGVLRSGGEGQPAALQTATRGTGVWFNLEVDDFDGVFTRLRAGQVEIVVDPEVTSSGVQRFVARDPNGILVYVTPRTTGAVPIHREQHQPVSQPHP
jgi:hypothetical protein